MSFITNRSIGRYGRFANGLFQIMGLIGIAKKHNAAWGVDPWINHDHRDRFGSQEDVDIYKHLAEPLPGIPDRTFTEINYHWGYHEIQLPQGDFDIRGHFQSPKYFHHAMDDIRGWLRFKGESPETNCVAIHVRRGDYDDKYHPLLQRDYYEKAMSLFPGRRFMVFSDDLGAAMELLGGLDNLAFSIGRTYLEDFKAMKSCHSFICANSSFSYAAALLANQPGKEIVMPRNWFGPAWGNPEAMTIDLYPENCVIL